MGLLVACFCVDRPLQPVVYNCADIFVLPDDAYFLVFDHEGAYAALVPSEIDDDFPCVCYVKFQEFTVIPFHQPGHCKSVRCSFSFQETREGSVISKT